MSFPALLARDVTILTATSSTNRYGDTAADWSAPASRTAQCWFDQQTGADLLSHRSGIVTQARAFFDTTSSLAAGERVVIDDATYEVIGSPDIAWTPRGPHHIEAQLRAVAG